MKHIYALIFIILAVPSFGNDFTDFLFDRYEFPKTCFGALGIGCDGIIPFSDNSEVGCDQESCLINAGSWLHDECCIQHPFGSYCRPRKFFPGGTCTKEFLVGTKRLLAGFNWRRNVLMDRENNTSKVEFNLYCAPSGTVIHQEDVRYCCNKQARKIDLQKDDWQIQQQWVKTWALPQAVVCK